jgi:hypothetical protein
MSSDRNSGACNAVLRGLLSALCLTRQGITIPIALEKSWLVQWPRPDPQLRAVTLLIDSQGICDLQSWCTSTTQDFPCRNIDWWHKAQLSRLCSEVYSTSIWDLFSHTCVTRSLNVLHVQLLWSLGMQLQKCLYDVTKKTVAPRDISISTEDFTEIMDNPAVMDRKLAEYVVSGRSFAASLSLRAYSSATDKASVCGLGAGLQNTIFTLGSSGCAVFACPQARFLACFEGGHQNEFQVTQTAPHITRKWFRYAFLGGRPPPKFHLQFRVT